MAEGISLLPDTRPVEDFYRNRAASLLGVRMGTLGGNFSHFVGTNFPFSRIAGGGTTADVVAGQGHGVYNLDTGAAGSLCALEYTDGSAPPIRNIQSVKWYAVALMRFPGSAPNSNSRFGLWITDQANGGWGLIGIRGATSTTAMQVQVLSGAFAVTTGAAVGSNFADAVGAAGTFYPFELWSDTVNLYGCFNLGAPVSGGAVTGLPNNPGKVTVRINSVATGKADTIYLDAFGTWAVS